VGGQVSIDCRAGVVVHDGDLVVAIVSCRASMIRRYIIWRNNHAYDQRLCRVVARANVA
jgi:hypothetical protein